MAITSYSDLVVAVRDWLGRSNDTTFLPDNRVGEMIAFGEAEIYARLRVRQMETSADLTITAQSIALPADLIEVRRLYLDGTPILTLDYRSPPQFWEETRSNTAGRPSVYTIEGSSILIGQAPDATYTGKLLYYARPLSLQTVLNSIFAANPDLYLYGALAHAGLFTGAEDAPRVAAFREMFAAALARVQAQSDRAVSGAPLSIRIG
jgi:hypothetical protein